MINTLLNKPAAAVIVPLLYFLLLPLSNYYLLPCLGFAVFGLYLVFKNQAKVLQYDSLKWCLLAGAGIFLPMLFSLTDAVNFSESMRKTANFFLLLLMSTGMVWYFIGKRKIFEIFSWSVYCILVFWSVDALVQYFVGFNVFGYPYEDGRLTGIFYPSVRLGLILAVLAPVYLDMTRRLAERYFVAWFLLVPMFFTVLMTAGRNAWILLLLSIGLYIIIIIPRLPNPKRLLRDLFIALCICVTLGVMVFKAYPDYFNKSMRFVSYRLTTIPRLLTGDAASDDVLGQRYIIWESALRIYRDNWVNGVGPRGFRYAAPDYFDKPPILVEHAISSTHPHQLLLEVISETGSLGLLGMLLFWGVFLRIMYLVNRMSGGDTRLLIWFLPTIVVWLPINMHKALYGSFMLNFVWVLVTIAIACMASLEVRKQRSQADSE